MVDHLKGRNEKEKKKINSSIKKTAATFNIMSSLLFKTIIIKLEDATVTFMHEECQTFEFRHYFYYTVG